MLLKIIKDIVKGVTSYSLKNKKASFLEKLLVDLGETFSGMYKNGKSVGRAIIKNFKIMIAASPYIRLGGLLCKREEHYSPSILYRVVRVKLIEIIHQLVLNEPTP